MSSEVRQRNIKGRPDTKEEPLAGSKVSRPKKPSGGSSILPLLLLLGIAALGGAFFYINHTHGETYAQTGERIKQHVTQTIQGLSKTVEDLASKGTQAVKKTGGAKTLPNLSGLQSNHSKNFRLTYEDNALTLTSVRCEQPSTVDKDIKEIITWIGEEYGGEVESFSLPSYVCTQFSNRGFVGAVSSIAQSFKNLKTLNLNVRGAKGITDEGVIKVYQILADKLPNVEDLTLNFTLHVPQAFQITDKSVNVLTELLNNGKFKNLRRLSLNYAGFQNLTGEAVQRLFTAIGKNLPNLKDLGLDLRWIGNFQDSLLHHLSKEMLAGTYKNLERFYLNLDNNGENFSNGGFQEFAKGVAGLTSITHFHISFYGVQRVIGSGFTEIYKSLADKTKLEHLALLYPGCTGFADDALAGLTTLAKIIPNLKHFNMMLMKAALTSKSLVEIAPLFAVPLPKLEVFNLDLTTGDKIGNEGVNTLIQNLGKNAPNLKDFVLKTDSQKLITHEILALFASTFETSLHGLRKFHFGFRDLKGNYDEVAVQLFQSIGKNLKNLEDLWFTFGNMQITTEGIKGISQALSTYFRNLKYLKASLAALDGLNDDGFKVFSDALVTLKTLETLDIHLSGIQKSKSAGINYFLKKVTEMTNLKVLELTFMGVEGVSDDSVRILRTHIKELTNLRELAFDLTMNQGISDASLTNFATSVAESGLSLKRVKLWGIARPKRPPQLKTQLINLLPSVPEVEIMI